MKYLLLAALCVALFAVDAEARGFRRSSVRVNVNNGSSVVVRNGGFFGRRQQVIVNQANPNAVIVNPTLGTTFFSNGFSTFGSGCNSNGTLFLIR